VFTTDMVCRRNTRINVDNLHKGESEDNNNNYYNNNYYYYVLYKCLYDCLIINALLRMFALSL